MKTSNISIEDFKYFNWRLQILQLKTSNTSTEDLNWRLQIVLLKTSNTSKGLLINTNTWLPESNQQKDYLKKVNLFQDYFKVISRQLKKYFKTPSWLFRTTLLFHQVNYDYILLKRSDSTSTMVDIFLMPSWSFL